MVHEHNFKFIKYRITRPLKIIYILKEYHCTECQWIHFEEIACINFNCLSIKNIFKEFKNFIILNKT